MLQSVFRHFVFKLCSASAVFLFSNFVCRIVFLYHCTGGAFFSDEKEWLFPHKGSGSNQNGCSFRQSDFLSSLNSWNTITSFITAMILNTRLFLAQTVRRHTSVAVCRKRIWIGCKTSSMRKSNILCVIKRINFYLIWYSPEQPLPPQGLSLKCAMPHPVFRDGLWTAS